MSSTDRPESLPGAVKARVPSLTDFNALTVEERLRIIRNASGKQKFDLILEAKDADEVVRRLPSQEVYMLVKELGAEDCIELLAMATTGQMTTFFDLDFWQGEELAVKPTLEWLQMLLETSESKVLQTATELDFELLTVILQKFVTITRGLESLTDEDALAEGRLERIYDMDFLDAESAKIVGYFLDILYRRDRDFYILVMESVRHEVPAEVAEQAFSNRRNRLLDRGFPDPFEALGVFAYIDPENFSQQAPAKIPFEACEEEVDAPGFFLAVPAGDLLGEILSRGLEPDACWELTYLLNKVLIADRVDVSDLALVFEKTQEVYHYLNIALEYLGGGDFEAALGHFNHYYLEHLLRLGLSLTYDQQGRAEKVKRSSAMVFLDGPFRALVEALCHQRPRFYEGVLSPHRAGERPFANLEEVNHARKALDRLEAQLLLFDGRLGFELPDPEGEDLDGCVPDKAIDLALSDLFLTALGNRLMGRSFAPEPIPESELPDLWSRICEEGQVREPLREDTIRWTENQVSGAGDFAAYCLDLWQDGFCSLGKEDLDPRFIGGMIIRLA